MQPTQFCTYGLFHDDIEATHYYDSYEGVRVNLCFGCATHYGYPQYLREYPRGWAPEQRFIVNDRRGRGRSRQHNGVWPETESVTVQHLQPWFGPEAEFLLADALYARYLPIRAESGGRTCEVIAVTALPLVG